MARITKTTRQENQDKLEIGEFYRLVFEKPLYTIISNPPDKNRLLNREVRFDTYCPGCKKERTVVNLQQAREYYQVLPITREVLVFQFACLSPTNHHFVFLFLEQNDGYWKFGQYPSTLEMLQPQFQNNLNELESLLTEDEISPIRKALVVASNGYNIGAMTYLRRPFEKIINEELLEHCKDAGSDFSELSRLRIDEKIEVLSKKLPKFMSENSYIYSILSDGIHNLSDEECGDVFHICAESMLIILNERAEISQKRKREADISKRLASAKTKLTQRKNENT